LPTALRECKKAFKNAPATGGEYGGGDQAKKKADVRALGRKELARAKFSLKARPRGPGKQNSLAS